MYVKIKSTHLPDNKFDGMLSTNST